jgi:hypothetical protein
VLTLIDSRGQGRKITSKQFLYLGSSFSNMLFQNAPLKYIINPNPPMPNFGTCTTFFFQSIKPRPTPRTQLIVFFLTAKTMETL